MNPAPSTSSVLGFPEARLPERLGPPGILDTAQQEAADDYVVIPITGYLDEDGVGQVKDRPLQSVIDKVGAAIAEFEPAARMNQVIGIIDSYGYGAIIGKLFWQRAIVPMQGGQPDEAIVEQARPMVERCLAEFARFKGNDTYLAGPEVSLADLYLAPIFAYLTMTPDAEALLRSHGGLQSWWQAMSSRPAMASTKPDLG